MIRTYMPGRFFDLRKRMRIAGGDAVGPFKLQMDYLCV
jgi:hypothetical protein